MDYIIEKAVIYPMRNDEPTFEGNPIEDAQMDYFISYLPSNRYLSNMKRSLTPYKTLVLFQYRARIIASRVLIKKEPIEHDEYSYASYFDPSSITIFLVPITAEDMKRVSKKFVRFQSYPSDISQDEIPELLYLIQEKQPLSAFNPLIFGGDDITYQEEVNGVNNPNGDIEYIPRDPVISEKSAKSVYGRNKLTAARAQRKAKYHCEIEGCIGHHFVAAATNKNYVEAHHLIPFEMQVYYKYSLDVEANIISLCVFCHSKLHYGIPEEKVTILSQLYAERVEFLKLCEISIELEQLLSYYHPATLKALRKSAGNDSMENSLL